MPSSDTSATDACRHGPRRRAAFPRGNLLLSLRDGLGPVFDDGRFARLFPAKGRPAEAPWRLALVTLLQFAEGLSDREAADAVRGRLDCKYLLGLPLVDTGFDGTVLCEFRARLVAGRAEELLLDAVLEAAAARSLLRPGGVLMAAVADEAARRLLAAVCRALDDHGGFSEAARRTGVAPSSVARLVDSLEERLGTRLLNRTTRAVTPTDAGALFRADAARILADLEAAEEAVSERAGATPRGLLRATLPMTFGRLHVAPTLGALHARCPAVELDLRLTDAVEDIAAEGIDLALRIGPPPPPASRLVARRLAGSRRVVCGSADYLARRGVPAGPADLAAHACLAFRYADGRRAWRFARADGGAPASTVEVSGPLRADNAEVLREAALDGVGLAMLPTWLVGPDVASGRLRTVLDGYEADPGRGEADPAPGGVWALFPPERRGSLRLRAFLDHLVALFAPSPPWEAR